MISELLTVDEYIESVPIARINAINTIRKLCQKYLINHQETMFYKMPTYIKNDIAAVAFNNQKNYISLYIMNNVIDKYRNQFKDCGKSCIRFKKVEDIDFELIGQILAEIESLR